MNWWTLPAAKCLALLAALALPFAPVDLLAHCGCWACGCAAAAEDSPGCCCDLTEQPASRCCQPAGAPVSDGCSCEQSAPASPTGTLPNYRTAPDTHVHLAAADLLPPIAPCDSAAQLALSGNEPHQTVPVRILLCVWRN